MQLNQATKNVDELFELYEKYGQSDYIGEPVSQVEHMIQAARLAEAEGYDDEIILAAFFHDIGHLCEFIMPVQQMEGAGVVDHERIGAEFLKGKGFSHKISKLVQSHVAAKRYLTYKYPEYRKKLSPASMITLQHQGGIMTAAESTEFENDPLQQLYIKLREWDDKAKEINELPVSLDQYRQMALEHLLHQ